MTQNFTIYVKSDSSGKNSGGCPFCQKSLICLALHEIRADIKLIDTLNKPQDFLNLNQADDNKYKFIGSENWKQTVPVFQDNKKLVRIFSSDDIVKYIESMNGAKLSENNVDINKISGAESIYSAATKLAKHIGSNPNQSPDVKLVSEFKDSIQGINDYICSIFPAKDDPRGYPAAIYLNGTKEISLLDIQLIPKLHNITVLSETYFNINIANRASKYQYLSKYINYAYAQDYWRYNRYPINGIIERAESVYGLKNPLKKTEDELKQENETESDENIGFYLIPNSKEKLLIYLKAAVSLELSTLPLYMTALYSFKDDEYLSETAKNAKLLIHEVMMDEMLHINLCTNIIASIYGKDQVTTKYNIPYGKGLKLPANIRADIDDVSLKPFSKDALFHSFIQIEAPTTLAHHHKVVKNDDGSIRYPFEPIPGSNSVTLSFPKKDELNQIGEFYNAIKCGLKRLDKENKINFNYDSKSNGKYYQRKWGRRTTETAAILNVNDAIACIDVICSQGEGYELKEGVFAAVATDDDDDIKDNYFETSEKTHFIKFIELLVGRKLVEVTALHDDDHVDYKFIFEDETKQSLKVNFEKEIYSIDNFKKPAENNLFNKEYKNMLELLTDGLRDGNFGPTVGAMKNLKTQFKICMDKGVFPNFAVPEFPLPPSVPKKY